VIGVEPGYESQVSTVPGLIRRGRYLGGIHAQEVVIGSGLARNLRIGVGGELTLLGGGKDGSVAATVLPIVGVFETGSPELDRGLVQMPLATFQEVFSLDDEAHSIAVRGTSLPALEQTRSRVIAVLPADADLAVRSWEELIPGLKQLIQADMAQNWFLYISLIVIVTFSILNTFLMSVLERTREFGVMLALGATPLKLGRLVLLESLLLTLFGLAIGIAIGASIALYLSVDGFSFPGMKELHAQFGLPGVIFPKISVLTLTLGPAVILVFTMLAALYPALRLRRLQPVEAMHAV
jgi:putative ABC transport system permease protein